MSSTDYDRIIAQERKVLVSINEHGEKLILEFKRTAASYIREFGIYLMRGYYTNRPEVVRSLGPEKIAELKREFTDLLDELPEHTNRRLVDSQIWLHRAPIPDQALTDMTYSYHLEQRANRSMDQALRDLIGLIGSLLSKYGFIEVGKDYEWNLTPGGILLYTSDLPSQGMDHYQALTKLMENYKDIIIEYVYAIQNLRKAEQAQRSAQADGF